MVRRLDVVPLTGAKRTAAGVLVVPASLSRTGLQTYRTADGRSIVEYRPEAEVFAPTALETVRGAVVTVGHTNEARPRGVGLASDREPAKAVRDGEHFVETALLVTDADTAAKVEAKALTEISLGYDADIDPTPGVAPNGQRYDAIQRNIRVHHVALLGAGQARAGREARIRLDGNEEICQDPPDPGHARPTHEAPVTQPAQTIVKIKLDGKEFVEGSADHIGHLNSTIEALRASVTKSATDVAAAQAATATEKARADGLQTELDKAKANVPQAVADELKFRDSIASILPKQADGKPYDFTGKDRTAIKRDAIGADACKRVDAQPEASRAAYLDGCVEFALAQAKTGTPSYAPASGSNAGGVPRADAAVEGSIQARSDAMFKGPGK